MVLKDLLPDTLQGWNVDKTIPLTTHNAMYSYMDGGAELYISYGFKEGLSCSYKKENQPEVIAEVFDLNDSRNAFGVFSQTREKENLRLGQGAYSIPGAIFFWKDQYYFSLSAWESTPDTESFLRALGGYSASKVPGTGELPALVKLLPEEGLVPFGYLYFHHYIWLNSYYFITDANLFHIEDNTDAVLAKYSEAENRQYLLLIQYNSKEDAAEAFTSFGCSFFPEGLVDNCIRLEDKTWLAASLAGRMIIAVFNGTTRQDTHQLLTNVLGKCRTISLKQNL
jgi:hypothetical protein